VWDAQAILGAARGEDGYVEADRAQSRRSGLKPGLSERMILPRGLINILPMTISAYLAIFLDMVSFRFKSLDHPPETGLLNPWLKRRPRSLSR
jgi:hypothetical protein